MLLNLFTLASPFVIHAAAESTTRLCGAAVPAGLAQWRSSDDGVGLVLVVDAVRCHFGSTPRYFASILGKAGQPHTTKVASLFQVSTATSDVSPFGFQLYAFGGTAGANSMLAEARANWGVAWQGAMGRNTGSTRMHRSGWRQLNDSAVSIAVSTARARFVRLPHYIISLNFDSAPRAVTGQHAIYGANNTGFSVYMRPLTGLIHAVGLESAGWTINWLGATSRMSGAASGSWSSTSTPAVCLRVDTKWADIAVLSFLITLQHTAASSDALFATGASNMVFVSQTGFRACFVARPRVTSAWRVNYIAFEAPQNCAVSKWSKCTCKATCGSTHCVQKRTIVLPRHQGRACPALLRQRPCPTLPACPSPCRVTPWGAWSRCTACTRNLPVGERVRRRAVLAQPTGGGKTCPATMQSRSCAGTRCPSTHARPCGRALLATNGYLLWKRGIDDPRSAYLDIDASHCQFATIPAYVASIVPSAGMPFETGVHTISQASSHGFRLTVWHSVMQGQALVHHARNTRWSVSWIADASRQSGSSTVGRTGWAPGGRGVLTAYISTGGPSTVQRPNFVISLCSGVSLLTPPVLATGGHTIYNASGAGFRVFIAVDPKSVGAQEFTARDAETYGLRMMWIAMPGGTIRGAHADFSGHVIGAWQQSSEDHRASKVDIDVHSFGFDTIPAFVASIDMGEESGRWSCSGGDRDALDGGYRATFSTSCGLMGAGSLGSASPQGFRVLLAPSQSAASEQEGGSVVLAALSNMMGWRVNYIAYQELGCRVAQWGTWSTCSKSCGGGLRTRRRRIEHAAVTLNISARYRGGDCPRTEDVQQCNVHACVDYCKFGPWTSWSSCSLTCGGGVRTSERTRLAGRINCVARDKRASRKQTCATRPCPARCPCLSSVSGELRFGGVNARSLLPNVEDHGALIRGIADAAHVSPHDVHLRRVASTRSELSGHDIGTAVAYQVEARNTKMGSKVMQAILLPSFTDRLAASLKHEGVLPPFFANYKLLRSMPQLQSRASIRPHTNREVRRVQNVQAQHSVAIATMSSNKTTELSTGHRVQGLATARSSRPSSHDAASHKSGVPMLAFSVCAVLIATAAFICAALRRSRVVGGGAESAEECVPLTATPTVRAGVDEDGCCDSTAPVLIEEQSDDDDELFSAGPPPV